MFEICLAYTFSNRISIFFLQIFCNHLQSFTLSYFMKNNRFFNILHGNVEMIVLSNIIIVDSSICLNFSIILMLKILKSEINQARFSTIKRFSTILQSTIAGFYCALTLAWDSTKLHFCSKLLLFKISWHMFELLPQLRLLN